MLQKTLSSPKKERLKQGLAKTRIWLRLTIEDRKKMEQKSTKSKIQNPPEDWWTKLKNEDLDIEKDHFALVVEKGCNCLSEG